MASNKILLYLTIALSAVAFALAVAAAVLAGLFLASAHLHPSTLPLGAASLATGVAGAVGWILLVRAFRKDR